MAACEKVDMSKAVKGATVHFECGGKAEISDLSKAERLYRVFIFGYGSIFYSNDGVAFCSWAGNSLMPYAPVALLNITKIDPPAFDWSTVKRGMAFKRPSSDGLVYYYIASHLKDPCKAVFFIGDEDGISWYDGLDKKSCIRAPEHDIEVDNA